MPEKRVVQSRLVQPEADFYTVGYEKLPLEDLFALLREAGVRCLVDVRDTPWSRVPDYRKDALEDRLSALGAATGYHIKYVSMPSMGNPPENRKSDRPATEMMTVYRQHALSKTRELEELREIIAKCRTALMCYEADPAECHRSMLAGILAEKYGLTYTDLRTR